MASILLVRQPGAAPSQGSGGRRGAAPLRERIEAIIDPQSTEVPDRGVKSPTDPKLVLGEVTQFAALARSGAYLAGDRRVSRQERSRWRHTFRRLSGEAQDALRGHAVATEFDAGRHIFQDEAHVRGLLFDALTGQAESMQTWARAAQAELARWPDIQGDDPARERAVQRMLR
jgi:hypothetical protein